MALALLAGCLNGCFLWTTRGEGDQLLAQSARQHSRLDALERGVSEEREALTNQVERAKAQVAELEAVLTQATQVVTRNSADLGIELRRMQEQLATVEGQIAELRNRLQESVAQAQATRAQTESQLAVLAQKLGLDVVLDPADIPPNADALFSRADSAFSANELSRARALYLAFLERYPRDPRADDARFRTGKTYLAQERPATALGQFRIILADHASGDMVDDALLAMAEAFYQLNTCRDARDALNALIRGHRRSPLVRQAQQKLQTITRAPAGYCRD